ncbi:5508_t:CDS:2 [Ambispora leptoticha]|uniref:5508_t:CDS:1 n=1 Tax=Ambispora leptoticha TaxID=144679 RepID=A0A9N8WPF6_9GLOM|nr:5508_t:CDS:2 [Ambispora leptoticha]
MTTASTSKTFLIQVSSLYQSTDKVKREQANAWLQAFQKTPEAWTIVDQILRLPDVSPEAKFHAARTFRSKLDANGRNDLRDSLLDLLYQYRAGPRNIITQICLSLAALALQMLEWQGVLSQFISVFGKDPETVSCLLEFLKVLPEEVNDNRRIPIKEEEYRVRSKELLTDNAEEVIRILLICLQNSGSNTEYHRKVFEALSSWLYSGDIPINSLAANPLLGLSFDALQSEELYDNAVDVVCQIIQESQDIPDSMPVIEQIYTRLLPLREPLKIAVSSEDEDDKVRGYCRIFTHAGESYLPLVVQHSEAFRSIVEAIADCTAYHDTEIVRITFGFWHRLADTLFEPRHAEIKPKFDDIFANLVDVMIKHLHYPKIDVSWTAQKRDEFREFRHVMGDVLKDCCILLGSERCLSKPYATLSAQLANAASGKPVDWQDIEAPLFSLRAMGSEIEDEENVILPQIMQLISQLPNHPKIRYAATLVISRYSYWTRKHPEFIPYQLTYISSGFDNDEVAAAAALALKFLCKDCSELLIEYLPQLHPFYLSVTTTLHGVDLIEVTEAVTHVIAAVPPNELLNALQMFCLPIAQKLAEIANKGATANETDIKEACEKTDQLSIMIRVIAERRDEKNPPAITPAGQTHPCISIIQEMWPVFDQLLTHFGGHAHFSEAICKCFKYCVVSYRDDFRPLLPALMERLVTTFDGTGLSCYLWVATKCVREHIDREGSEVALTMLSFVQSLSITTFRILNEKKIIDIPDVIEEYFRLNIAFVDSVPATFIHSSILSPIFQAGLQSLAIEQQDALYAVLIFFSRLLSYGVSLREPQPANVSSSISQTHQQSILVNTDADIAALEVLIRQHGIELVSRMLDGLLHIFPRDLQIDVDNVFKSLARILPMESQQWMADVVQRLPENEVTQNDRNAFISEYSRAIQEKDWSKQRRVLNDFVAVCKRIQYSSRRRRSTDFAD